MISKVVYRAVREYQMTHVSKEKLAELVEFLDRVDPKGKTDARS